MILYSHTVLSAKMKHLSQKCQTMVLTPPLPKKKNSQERFLHVENPMFHKNSSITTMSMKTREMKKRFCQINQVFDDNGKTISCHYYNFNKLSKLSMNRHHKLFTFYSTS